MYERNNGFDDIADIHRKMQEEEESSKNDFPSAPKSHASGLSVSSSDDDSEKQADAIARKVSEGGNARIGKLAGGSSINAKHSGTPIAPSPEFESKLNSSKGGGQTLDDSTKYDMESKMGADFGNVRIHTGNHADELSTGINAKAFTYGNDIYFKNGNYNTSTAQGKELLAHELVHTQQPVDKLQRDDDGPPQYTIRSGDTLRLLAERFSLSVQAILAENAISLKNYTDADVDKPLPDNMDITLPKDALNVPVFIEKKHRGDESAKIMDPKTSIRELCELYFVYSEKIAANYEEAYNRFFDYWVDKKEDQVYNIKDMLLKIAIAIAKPFLTEFGKYLFAVIQQQMITTPTVPTPPSSGPTDPEYDWKGPLKEGGMELGGMLWEEIKEEFSDPAEFKSKALWKQTMQDGIKAGLQKLQKQKSAFIKNEEEAYENARGDSGKYHVHRILESQVAKLYNDLQFKATPGKILRDLALNDISENAEWTKDGRPKITGSHIEYNLYQEGVNGKVRITSVEIFGESSGQFGPMLSYKGNQPEYEDANGNMQHGWLLNMIKAPVHVKFTRRMIDHYDSNDQPVYIEDTGHRWLAGGKMHSESRQDKRLDKAEKRGNVAQAFLNSLLQPDAIKMLPPIDHFGKYYTPEELKEQEESKRKAEKEKEDRMNKGGIKKEDLINDY